MDTAPPPHNAAIVRGSDRSTLLSYRLTAPSDAAQLAGTLAEIQKGPLTAGEMSLMREYGYAVHAQGNRFT